MTESSIVLSLAESTAPRAPRPYPAGKPNVVVIVLDDLGFAQLGCYGSSLDTPNLDRLAERGLRFTNFHTTAVCSPTRACLLTGRNHHRVGMGMLPDLPINYPGYTGEFPSSAGTMAQILLDQGYSTTAIGKWHLVPRDQRASGPFNMWPTGVGFERYYGFLNGETNQWTPNLIRDQQHVEPPATPDEGYHLDADLADEAITQLRSLHIHNPDRPFLLWYATGAPHAPHQVAPEWIEPFAGRFDSGWDVMREETFARQKALGVVPADAELSARPEWVEAWDDIDPDRRRLYARMMEVYAGFLAHTDHHIGRVLDEIERLGQADNTIVMAVSDNGASAEGGPNGSWNQLRHYISDEPDDLVAELARYDDLGGFKSSGHYPWGWALAGNTPFRRWKRYTFEGGVRDPFIVSWPGGLDGAGTIRDQYAHAIDVLPTLLDLLGIDSPEELGGVSQMSFDGTTMRPVLEDAAAPDTRTEQYYECWGSRAIYADGWKAVTNHVNQLTAAERDAIVGSNNFSADEWQLFQTATDFSESVDLAESHPEKLAELIGKWDIAAEQNQVLPLDDGRVQRSMQISLPWLNFRATHELRPGDKLHEAHAPIIFGGFRMVAWFDAPIAADASGVLAEQGDWIAGWAWFLRDGELTWILTTSGVEHRISARVLPGCQAVSVSAIPAAGGGFDLSLAANGEELATAFLDGAIPSAISPDGAFLTVGYGRPFPVCDDYVPPSPAPGSFVGLRVDGGNPPPLDFEMELDRVLRHQ
ncbi:MAG: arylsulfatase A-like enzyme [Candidatus Aldehydirespiratoraceae bacterium]|jgi:arylsulfatase A-like enzyme